MHIMITTNHVLQVFETTLHAQNNQVSLASQAKVSKQNGHAFQGAHDNKCKKLNRKQTEKCCPGV